MQAVYKYSVPMTDYFKLALPVGARVLTVQAQGDEACLWALVDPAAEKETRSFRLAGTGHPIDERLDLRFISTFQLRGGLLVFHVFEVVEWPEEVRS